MALVRMKPPVGVSVGLGADDKLYYIDGQGFANVDSGSVTKLTAEGWVSAVPVAPEAPGNTFPVVATKTLTGGSRFLINGAAVDGEWVTTPAIFKLLLNGTGSVTMDSRDAAGVVSLAVYSEVLSGAVNQIGFPYSGDGAMAVRFNIPATATVQVI